MISMLTISIALVLALISNQPSDASDACAGKTKNMLGATVACKDLGGSAAEFLPVRTWAALPQNFH